VKSFDVVRTRIHPQGHIFIAIFFVVTLALWSLSTSLGWIGAIATLWCVTFFRDPERYITDKPDILVSPADGTVSAIGTAVPPQELDMGEAEMTRISVFLSVFNVHVNRVPEAGTISRLVYVPGKFLDAADERASEQNERQLVRLDTKSGDQIAFAQVAGLVARRIICDLKEGQTVDRGERFGLIRFGSRTDIYLPKSYVPSVKLGQTMIGGETVLAEKLTDKIKG